MLNTQTKITLNYKTVIDEISRELSHLCLTTKHTSHSFNIRQRKLLRNSTCRQLEEKNTISIGGRYRTLHH